MLFAHKEGWKDLVLTLSSSVRCQASIIKPDILQSGDFGQSSNFFKSKHKWESWLLLKFTKELRLSDECQRTALRTCTNCVYVHVRVLTALWRMKRTHRSAGVSAVWVWHSRSYLLASVWCSARWEVFYSWLETCSTCLHWSHRVQSRILLKWWRDTDVENL